MTSFGMVVVLTTWAALRSNAPPSHGPAPRDTACGDSAKITWTPRAPRQGALFRVRVTGAERDVLLAGTAAGEPLHFTNAESFAAIPIDASDTLGVVVECRV